MTETPPTYITKYSSGSLLKTYSLTLDHVAKVADMSERSGDSQGQVVRSAIDLRWAVDQAAEQLVISPDELQAQVIEWINAKVARSNGHES